MITSLPDIKTYLGITGTSQDSRLTILQASCEAYAKGIIGEIEQSTSSERVQYRRTHTSGTFLVSRYPVTAITKIDGQTVSLVNEVDWISTRNYVTIPELWRYISQISKYDSWSIEYTAGYTSGNMPADIKLAIYLLISAELSKDSGQGIKKVRLGEREVEYDMGGNQQLVQAKSILNKYRPSYNFVS